MRMKWQKCLVGIVILVTVIITGLPNRDPETLLYAKENKETSAYTFPKEDTVIIGEGDGYVRDEAILKKLKKVKHIIIQYKEDTFMWCNCEYFPNVETIYISKDTVSLDFMGYGSGLFPKLKKINVDSENPVYQSYKGALYTKGLKWLIYYPQCGKTDVWVPSANIAFEADVFEGVPITSIQISKQNPNYVSIDGVVYSKDRTYLYYWPEGKETESLVLPDELEYLDCSKIANFEKIKTIRIPKALTAITNTENNKLEKIVLSEGNDCFRLYDGVLYSSNEKYIRLYPNQNSDTKIEIDPKLEVFPMELFYTPNTTESLTLPSGLQMLSGEMKWGEVLLGGFTNLSVLKFDGENPSFSLVDGILYNKDETSLLWYPINLDREEFVIPDTVKMVENDQLVKQNYLKKLTISDSCIIYDYSKVNDFYIKIEMPVGKYCPNLAAYSVSKKNESYTAANGVLFSKDMTCLLSYPSAKTDKQYTIPETVTTAPFGNSNPYLETLTLSSECISVASDQYHIYDTDPGTVRGESYKDGLVHYSALKKIEIHSGNATYTSIDGVLYQNIEVDHESGILSLVAYPAGKPDAEFKLPENLKEIENTDYLKGHSYVKKIYVDGNSEWNGIENGKLLFLYQNKIVDLPGIEVMIDPNGGAK